MKQWERVAAMECEYAQAEAVLKNLEEALEQLESIRPGLRALDEYLGSPLWYRDRATDEAGGFPPELRRGVLTEDAIYDLLAEHRQMRERSLSLLEELW